MSEKGVKSEIVQFWVSPEMNRTVRNIAKAEERSISAVFRDLVEKGLIAGGYRSGSQDLAGMVREAVREELRPQVERLASISAKGTQVSAAAFFIAAHNGRQALPDYLKVEYDEIVARSRKLGIEYLKLTKDKNLDEFISKGAKRLEEDE